MTTYTPDSYLRAEAAKNQITQEVAQLISQRDRAVDQIRGVEKSLQRMSQGTPAGWSDLVIYVRAQNNADPTDTLWADLRKQIDKIVADFQAERQRTTQMITRIEQVT